MTIDDWKTHLGRTWENETEGIRLVNICHAPRGDYVEILYVLGFNQGLRTTAHLDKWETFTASAKLLAQQ